ncbi:MAG: DUF1294 domain-containing protein [Lysobacter sp.]
MEQLGKVLEWNDAKGYGFIAAVNDATPAGRVFFHIRDYERCGRRPEVNELVRYIVSRRQEGQPRAQSVRRAVQPSRPLSRPHTSAGASMRQRELPTATAVMLILAYAAAVALAVDIDRLPLVAGFALALLSVAIYIAYALDKHAAEHGRWRIQESTLHGLELLGGWPGALLAQRVMRHKTRKANYRAGFWMSVVVNCTVLGWWVLRH